MWKNGNCDVTWSLPPPLCHKLLHFLRPPPPLERDILYGRPLSMCWIVGGWRGSTLSSRALDFRVHFNGKFSVTFKLNGVVVLKIHCFDCRFKAYTCTAEFDDITFARHSSTIKYNVRNFTAIVGQNHIPKSCKGLNLSDCKTKTTRNTKYTISITVHVLNSSRTEW